MLIALNKRDAQRVRQWAKDNDTTEDRVIAWLVQSERIRIKTGPPLADIALVERYMHTEDT